MTNNDQRSAERTPAGGATVRADGSAIDPRPAAIPSAPPGSMQTVRATEPVVPAGYTPTPAWGADRTRRADDSLVQPGAGVPVVGAGVVGAVRPGSTATLGRVTYHVVRRLGRPSSEAEVFLAEGARGPAAIKYYFPHVHPDAAVLAKVRGLAHPNVVGLLDFGEYDGRSYEVLEFAAGGTLLDVDADGRPRHLPLRDEARIRELVRDAAAGIAHCHAHNLIHRDVKPENMFFRDEGGRTLQVADFGIAVTIEEGTQRHVTRQGRTPTYAAPEIYLGVDGLVLVGKEVDYYALGVTILHLWLGADPFAQFGELGSVSIKSEGLVDLPEDMSPSLLRLVAGLLATKPRNRWGHDEVERWLRGEFVELREPVGPQQARRYEPLLLGAIGRDGREVTVTRPDELAEVLPLDRGRSLSYLYRDQLVARWVEKAGDLPLAQDLRELVEVQFPSKGQDVQSRANEGAALAKAVYLLDTRTPFRTHGGAECRDCGEIADALERERPHYVRALPDRNDPLYLYLEARREKAFANQLRRYALEVSAARPQSAERAFSEIVLALRGWQQLRVLGEVFDSPAAIMAAARPVRDHVAAELTVEHSMASLWLENLMHGDPGWRSRLDAWRRAGRHNWLTLSYVLDPRAPFDFLGTPVRTLDAFTAELGVHVGDPRARREMLDPASAFVQEADYWLTHYAPALAEGAPSTPTGYAEVLGLYLADTAVPESERADVRECVAQLVEARFTRGDTAAARRSALTVLEAAAPQHQLIQLRRAEIAKSEVERTRLTRGLPAQAGVRAGKSTGEMALAGAAVLLLPVTLGALAPSGYRGLGVTVAVAGMGSMAYGLRRGLNSDSDESAAEAAKWGTILPFGGVLTLYWAIQFVVGVTQGILIGGLFSLVIRVVLSVVAAYALAIPATKLIVRLRTAQRTQGAPASNAGPVPSGSAPASGPDEAAVLDAVTRAWQQRPMTPAAPVRRPVS